MRRRASVRKVFRPLRFARHGRRRAISHRDMIAFLGRNGFRKVPGSGHSYYRNAGTGRTVSVSNHHGDLSPGLINRILRKAGLSRQQFNDHFSR